MEDLTHVIRKDVRMGFTHPLLVISHVDGEHIALREKKRPVVLETSRQDRARKDKQRYGVLRAFKNKNLQKASQNSTNKYLGPRMMTTEAQNLISLNN